jgi:hypothetical protein
LRALLLPASLLLAGCGASTVRLAVAPTLDTGGHAGFNVTVSLGLGTPLDFHGRSHHYFQGLTSVGGGRDGATGGRMFVATQDFDYVHWAEPRFDVRAGLHAVFQSVASSTGSAPRGGGGAHVGVLPMVYANDASWLLIHVCVGPELRGEALSGNPAGGALGLFSLPLVTELNLLGAGD